MSKDKISEYAFTPAANTDIGGINIDEGCAPSGINNAIRTLMTQIRDLQAGVSGDTIPLTAGGTGSGTAASARAALGLAIGTNVLGYVTPGASGNVLQSDGANWTSVAQSAAVTLDNITGGPLTVAKGGTGATALASGSVLVGNGTSTVNLVAAGASGQVLTSNGTTWTSAAAPTGGFSNMQVFASPGTFTTPSTTTRIKVTVVGGGGSGGRRQTSVPSPTGPGGSGAGGGTAIYVGPVSASTPYSVTVGAGGAGQTSSPAAGNPGGTSSFGSLASATGGAGGVVTPDAGVGGIGTAGTLLAQGGSGEASQSSGNPVTVGGSSMFGGGTRVPSTVGGQYGGGGGGVLSPCPASGAGASGVVIVEW